MIQDGPAPGLHIAVFHLLLMLDLGTTLEDTKTVTVAMSSNSAHPKMTMWVWVKIRYPNVMDGEY